MIQNFFGLKNWGWIALICFIVAVIPIASVFSAFFSPENEIWKHLLETSLLRLVENTFWLTLGVAVGTLLLGVGAAWLIVHYDFPGKTIFEWALVLPMAMPAYVIAFVNVGLFDFSGPFQFFLREAFGAEISQWIPPIRSRGGVIWVMTLALYPYVYLLSRNAFLSQSQSTVDAARSLGRRPWRVILPMARPWIVAGLLLVVMETLADFGAVSVFNYETLTVGIYQAWYGFFSLEAAAQLASFLVFVAFLLVLIEQRYKSKISVADSVQGEGKRRKETSSLKAGPRFLTQFFLSGIVFFGFLLPTVQLVVWSFEAFREEWTSQYFSYLYHSLIFSLVSAVLVVSVAYLLSYVRRINSHPFVRLWIRLSTFGYALPGTVLAVGFFLPMIGLDRWLSSIGLPMIFTATIIAPLVAYLVRFLTVGFLSVSSSLKRVNIALDEAAHSLGKSRLQVIRQVHLPLLKGGLFSAGLLVFVEVMKEMPITVMTRPFGWDTLAVKIFEMTSEGEWERAAVPSLGIVLMGLIPIVLLMRQGKEPLR